MPTEGMKKKRRCKERRETENEMQFPCCTTDEKLLSFFLFKNDLLSLPPPKDYHSIKRQLRREKETPQPRKKERKKRHRRGRRKTYGNTPSSSCDVLRREFCWKEISLFSSLLWKRKTHPHHSQENALEIWKTDLTNRTSSSSSFSPF